MRKYFYNRYVKLAEFLCIMLITATMIIQSVDIVDEYVEKERQNDELLEEYYDYEEISESVYTALGQCVDELVAAYKQGGMTSLHELCLTSEELLLNSMVVASDGKYIHKYGLSLRELHNDENSDDVLVYGDWQAYNGLTMGIEDNIFLEREYLGYDMVPLGKYLSSETVEYLESIDYALIIKIAATNSLYNAIESEYWNKYETALEETGIEESFEKTIYNAIPVYIAEGMVILVLTVLLLISCGREPEGKKELNYYERGYAEIHIALAVAIAVVVFFGIIIYFEEYRYMIDRFTASEIDTINALFTIAVTSMVALFYYEMGIVLKKFINRRFIKDWLSVRILIILKKYLFGILKRIKAFFGKRKAKLKAWYKKVYSKTSYAALLHGEKIFRKKVIADIVMAVMSLIMIIIPFNTYLYDTSAFLYVVMLCYIGIYYFRSYKEYKYLRQYNEVCKAVDTISSGDYSSLQVDDDNENENDTLIKLANLSVSFEESVRKQVEAEKMQIELVANVSHDLKTPLTSIISYVDLLKEEEMSDVAKDYVKILIDKSTRLKEIVADVFDLAKATSGEQVPMEEMDGVVLINQILSDMNDVIEQSKRDLRVKIDVEAAPIYGNGQKLYRVFQNIIDNALKYSMQGTRIYLNGEVENGQFVIKIKNISQYEMDYSADEIMSRFTRGDKSRHSEGNGLGLSIAKSFTELCGGEFEVIIDGDVFEAIVRLK